MKTPHLFDVRAWHHGLVYLGLVLLHVVFAARMTVPTALYDEFIYLGFGRFFAGSAALPNVHGGAFGSFGYGLFIVPAFLFHTRSFLGTYRLVLLINSVIMSLSYFPLYYIARTVLRVDRFTAVVISLLTCLYPSFLLFSNFAISENVFIPLFLLVIVCATRFVEQATAGNAVAFGLSAGLLYSVHSRALAVVVFTIFLLIYLVATRRCSSKAAALAVCIAFCIITATRMADTVLMTNGWGGRTGEVTITRTLRSLFALNGVQSAFVAVVGETFYLLLSTVGLWAVGLGYGAINLCGRRKRDGGCGTTRRQVVCISFSLLCVLGVLAVSSLFIASYDPTLARPDFLVTGRYNEGVVAIPILFGLAFLLDLQHREEIQKKASRICLLVVVLAFVLSGAFIIPRFRSLEWLQGPGPRINIFAMMGWLRGFGTVNFTLIAAVSLSLFGLIYSFSRFKECVIVILGILFVTLAWVELRSDIWPNQRAIWSSTIGRDAGKYPLMLGGVLEGMSKPVSVSYDMAAWNPFLYANYQLWFPQARFLQFDSRSNEAPQSDVIIAGKSWKSDGQPAFLVGCETLADNCLFVGSRNVDQQLVSVPLGTEIGSDAVVGVDTEGLYAEEGDGAFRYRWTNGNAVLIFPVPDGTPPTQLFTKLLIPAKLHLLLRVNDTTSFDGTVEAGSWQIVFDLPRSEPGMRLRISLQSDTFVPKPVNGFTRTLGVRLVSLKLL